MNGNALNLECCVCSVTNGPKGVSEKNEHLYSTFILGCCVSVVHAPMGVDKKIL